MIGPTLAPARTPEPQQWGLRIGLGLLLALVVLVVAYPLLSPVDPTFESIAGLTELGEPLAPGAEGYPLGTDPRGRDMLARVIYAGGLTMLTALTAIAIATAAGLAVAAQGGGHRGEFGVVPDRVAHRLVAVQGADAFVERIQGLIGS